jgi:hypothetical protein
VGANGVYQESNEVHIYGSLWCASNEAVTTSSPADVKQELRLAGALTAHNTFTVGDDAYVAGGISTTTGVSVGGNLHVPDGAPVSGNVTYSQLVHEPVTVPPPCDCAPDRLIPVTSIVSAGHTDNDNATIGLDPDAMVSPGRPARLDLPCGRYYLSKMTSSLAMTIAAHGRAALFIDEIDTGGPVTITLDSTAELDIFVGGRMSISGPLTGAPWARPVIRR